MKHFLRYALAVIAGALVAIQLVPVQRTNPSVTGDVAAPGDVKAILRRACYDCHSHETAWPWYSRVAPISWLVAGDVNEARERLNFSVWESYPAAKRASKIADVGEEVGRGEMPLWYYLPMHPAARLSPADKAVLLKWAGSGNPGGGGAQER